MKICEFQFDQLDLSGKLKVDISGSGSLLITVAKNAYIGVPILLNGTDGIAENPGSQEGGFTGGKVGERGQGPVVDYQEPHRAALVMGVLELDQPLTREDPTETPRFPS